MEKYNVVSFSGGKDSTCMLLMMLEKGMKVDEVLFCDTGMEFPEMYKHLDDVEKFTGIKINRLKPEKTFEYYLLEHKKKKGKNIDSLGYGFPRMINRWCTGRLKQITISKHLKELHKKYDVVECVGIAVDEKERMKDKNYPLVEWEVTEKDALKYCKDKGFNWGGLYDIFNRVSCWCCPLQPLSECRKLYDGFPKLWNKLEEWEDKTYNNFRDDYSAHELRIRFELEKEMILENKSITNRVFYNKLKKELKRLG